MARGTQDILSSSSRSMTMKYSPAKRHGGSDIFLGGGLTLMTRFSRSGPPAVSPTSLHVCFEDGGLRPDNELLEVSGLWSVVSIYPSFCSVPAILTGSGGFFYLLTLSFFLSFFLFKFFSSMCISVTSHSAFSLPCFSCFLSNGSYFIFGFISDASCSIFRR